MYPWWWLPVCRHAYTRDPLGGRALLHAALTTQPVPLLCWSAGRHTHDTAPAPRPTLVAESVAGRRARPMECAARSTAASCVV
jgi:hypothetical protein